MTADSPPPNSGFSADDFAAALDRYDYTCQKGQIVSGKVVEYGSEGAYVDIGGKSLGIIPPNEASTQRFVELSDVLPLGEVVECLVVSEQDAEGRVKLSHRQLLIREAWEQLAEQQEAGKTVELYVSGTNRGGVTGEVNGLRAFVPRSHLVDANNMDALVGQTVAATLIEVDPERSKLVLSQREAARASLMSRLVPGSLVEGKVVNLKPYGAFIDLGGITGLLHVKQLSGKRIDSLETLLPLGKTVQVLVKEIDEWQGRVSLSTRELEAHPGELLEHFDAVMAEAPERAAKLAEQQAEGSSDSSDS